MTQQHLDDFRKNCASDAKDFYKELNDRIAFIIIAALGFFISKTDKLDQTNLFLIIAFFGTFVLLGLSFLFYLYNKHVSFKEACALIEFIDLKMKPDNPSLDEELVKKWEEARDKRNNRQRFIYIFLGAGLVMEIIFFMVATLNHKSIEKLPQPLKIEIVKNADIFVP